MLHYLKIFPEKNKDGPNINYAIKIAKNILHI